MTFIFHIVSIFIKKKVGQTTARHKVLCGLQKPQAKNFAPSSFSIVVISKNKVITFKQMIESFRMDKNQEIRDRFRVKTFFLEITIVRPANKFNS